MAHFAAFARLSQVVEQCGGVKEEEASEIALLIVGGAGGGGSDSQSGCDSRSEGRGRKGKAAYRSE